MSINLFGKKGIGVTDVVITVGLLGLMAIAAIKIVEVKFNASRNVVSKNVSDTLNLIEKVISNEQSCIETLAGKNIISKSRTFTTIRNETGSKIFASQDKISNEYIIDKLETANIDLKKGQEGVFLFKVIFRNTLDRSRNISARYLMIGKVNNSGILKSCRLGPMLNF